MALAASVPLLVGGQLALTGSSAPAAAEQSSLTLLYRCKFPVIMEQDLKLTIKVDVPKKIPVGASVQKFPIEAVATVNAETTDGLTAVEAATIEGTSDPRTRLFTPDRPKGVGLRVDTPMQKTAIPPVGPFDVHAGRPSPSQFKSTKAGPGRVEVGDLTLATSIRKIDGKATTLGDPVNVECVQKPGQKNVLAEFEFVQGPDTQKPSAPGRPEVTARGGDTVKLSWGRSEDDFGVYAYDVYQNGGTAPVLTTTGSTADAAIGGLTPNTGYTFTVRARDLTGNVSDPSPPVSVRTLDRDRNPPTAPGKLVRTGLAKNAVTMEWGESKDDVGVVGYEIYSGPVRLVTWPGTTGWVTGLQPEQTYTFTVRAKDAAGNLSPPSPTLVVRMPKGPPKECGELKGPDPDWIEACTYMAGFSNVNKLKGAAVLNDPAQAPTLTNVAYYAKTDVIDARFRFTGPLRSKTTFLTFGFMPTTATMELTQVGAGTLKGEDKGDGMKVHGTTKMSIRILDAYANGSPLKVGSKCRTVKPVELDLAGTAGYKNIKDGGPLESTMTVPAFSGCGVGEDLDRIFSRAVSGPGNLVRVLQGPVCQISHASCLPVDPAKVRNGTSKTG
ncbi:MULTISPECIES: fibronectin type III domain-containing protein [Actinomadura]|uniref:DUF6801 domain-containing protein n=2 Tax=Actinomadura yumaensis TaxID=111807 RepID=A0ABW2CFV9_9ACTN|nr:fibronectin type III domain-containing protein [Actinomadura sp. J1-007]MWK34788.1 hypothetical protein [Actinomadura sp. J1-007]